MNKTSWIWRTSNRADFPVWKVLVALALVVGLTFAFKLVFRTFPRVLASLAVLEEEWPDVIAQGSRFQFADSLRQEARFDLPIGWRLILDPEERLTSDDLLPNTVVVQQGRFLVVLKSGQRIEPSWKVTESREIQVTQAAFGKLRAVVWVGLFLLILVGFVVSLLGLALLAGLASGLLLLAEFLGVLKAPESPFAFVVLALVPLVLLVAALWAVGLLSLTLLWIAAVLAVAWVVGLCLLLPRGEDEEA